MRERGGPDTNKNGPSYESFTIRFNDNSKLFIKTKQSNLFKCMKEYMDETVLSAHGCKNPDECYIDQDPEEPTIFIIEKKFQQCPGSVCDIYIYS